MKISELDIQEVSSTKELRFNPQEHTSAFKMHFINNITDYTLFCSILFKSALENPNNEIKCLIETNDIQIYRLEGKTALTTYHFNEYIFDFAYMNGKVRLMYTKSVPYIK